MLKKIKKYWFIIWIILFSLILVTTTVIFYLVDKDFNDVRVKNSLVVIFGGVVILVIGILGYKKNLQVSDELSKTIQMAIFSYTHIGFLAFLSGFSLLQTAYQFKLEPQEVISIIFSGTLLIQIIISFIVKRKYS